MSNPLVYYKVKNVDVVQKSPYLSQIVLDYVNKTDHYGSTDAFFLEVWENYKGVVAVPSFLSELASPTDGSGMTDLLYIHDSIHQQRYNKKGVMMNVVCF